jgi:hypothetical protein
MSRYVHLRYAHHKAWYDQVQERSDAGVKSVQAGAGEVRYRRQERLVREPVPSHKFNVDSIFKRPLNAMRRRYNIEPALPPSPLPSLGHLQQAYANQTVKLTVYFHFESS